MIMHKYRYLGTLHFFLIPIISKGKNMSVFSYRPTQTSTSETTLITIYTLHFVSVSGQRQYVTVVYLLESTNLSRIRSSFNVHHMLSYTLVCWLTQTM